MEEPAFKHQEAATEGKSVAQIENLMTIYDTYKLESELWKSDIFVRNKQNVVDGGLQTLRFHCGSKRVLLDGIY